MQEILEGGLHTQILTPFVVIMEIREIFVPALYA